MFFLNGRMKCPSYEEKQYLTAKTNHKSFYWVLPLPFMITLLNPFGVPFQWIIPIELAALLICLAFAPSFMEFTDTQQPII